MMQPHRPQPSWRKPAGAFLIIAMVVIWAVLVSSASDWLTDPSPILLIAIYAVAGIIWIYPARLILVWMETGRWFPPSGD